MIEKQEKITVGIDGLLEAVRQMQGQGCRLVQIGCTKLDSGFELNYSFDREYRFTNIQVPVPSAEAVVPSVSGIYPSAFLYENEVHDLFGIPISGISVDYRGKFYRTSIPHPFGGAAGQTQSA